MARILFAWEYGSGMGHVAILMPLAKALQDAGHHITLALRDIKATQSLTENTGITVIQAPFIRPNALPKNTTTHTLADIYCYAGLSNPDAILALSQAWKNILSDEKPDLVITEFSPTLALITVGVIPTVTLGTGYSIPPANHALPNIRFWHAPLSRSSIQNERELFTAVQSVRRELKLAPLNVFSDLFKGDAQFVCTYPLLDCYKKYRKTPAIGSLNDDLYNKTITFDTKREHKAFAYLNAGLANVETIIAAIKNAGIPCEAYIRGLSPEKCKALSCDEFILHDTPQPLADILPHPSLFIHHGGISTSEMCLRYGTPQLILANHLEQRVNGAALQKSGVAKLLTTTHTTQNHIVSKAVSDLINSPQYLENAQHIAQELNKDFNISPIETVFNACEKLLTDETMRLIL